MKEPDFIQKWRKDKQDLLEQADAIEVGIQSALKKLGLDIPKIPIVDHQLSAAPDYPDYPTKDSIYVKANFLIERGKLNDWWKKSELENALIEQEKSKNAIKSLGNEMRDLVAADKFIMVKFNQSNKMVIYTNKMELLYKDDRGKWLPIHAMLPDFIKDYNKEIISIECSLNK